MPPRKLQRRSSPACLRWNKVEIEGMALFRDSEKVVKAAECVAIAGDRLVLEMCEGVC